MAVEEDYWAWGWLPDMPEDVKVWLQPVILRDWFDPRVELTSDQIRFLKAYVVQLDKRAPAPHKPVGGVNARAIQTWG